MTTPSSAHRVMLRGVVGLSLCLSLAFSGLFVAVFTGSNSAQASYVLSCRLKIRVIEKITSFDLNDSETTSVRLVVLAAKVGGRADGGCKRYLGTEDVVDLGVFGPQSLGVSRGTTAYFVRTKKDLRSSGGITRLDSWRRIPKAEFDAK
jgi:hypothetical protein